MADMADKKYTFLVHTDANKTMIKDAVEKMFEGTKVASCLLYTSLLSKQLNRQEHFSELYRDRRGSTALTDTVM